MRLTRHPKSTRLPGHLWGDLGHTYLLAYKPPPSTEQKWRTIDLAVLGVKNVKVHAKEGYLPE